jgi:transposase
MLDLNALPKGTKFTEHCFLEEVLPSLLRQRRRNHLKNAAIDFVVHMDNSMWDDTRKIAERVRRNKIQQVPHPAYSPDLSPCGFWLSAL